MKQPLLILFLLTCFCVTNRAQTTRYFEFTTNCGHGNWQDTSFIAAASSQPLIDSVLAELAKPVILRKFINGPIAHGHGGHNHNATHWFLWHFIPNQWTLAENAIEVCDGCPYSDLDADPVTWVDVLGIFCPWSGQPAREVPAPVTGWRNRQEVIDVFSIYPNPASNTLHIKSRVLGQTSLCLYNALGQELLEIHLDELNKIIDVSGYLPGFYFLKTKTGTGIKKLVIEP
jgi:hypothetical protein